MSWHCYMCGESGPGGGADLGPDNTVWKNHNEKDCPKRILDARFPELMPYIQRFMRNSPPDHQLEFIGFDTIFTIKLKKRQ